MLQTVVLEKIHESPLNSKEIQPIHPNTNQPWIFTGRTDAEAAVPIFWPPDVKSRLIGKDPDAGKDWRQEEKGATEKEVVGWHHWLNGHELEQTLGDGEGQGSLACCSPWGHKESDTTDWTTTIHGRDPKWKTLPNGQKLHLKCYHKVFRASQVAQLVKNSPANAEGARDVGLIPGLERSPGVGHCNL